MEESERLVEALQADILALRRKLEEKKQDVAGKGLNVGTESGESCTFEFQASCFYVLHLSAATADGPPEQRNNLLLHEAIRSLCACSSLFHTQTLTLEGFPIPSVCCDTEHDASAATGTGEHLGLCSLVLPSSIAPWKRLKEIQPIRESKRRKSSS